MFKWLTDFVDNTRIEFAYLTYEQECRRKWVREAKRTFSIGPIKRQIEERMTAPLHHVASAFDEPIRLLELNLQDVAFVISDAKAKQAILIRDYKTDLDRAYLTLNEKRGKLNECNQGLSNAFIDLKTAKHALDSWYAKAEGNWLGNGGKKLPDSAIFGQDLADRDLYKNRRDRAAQKIASYKTEKTRLVELEKEAREAVE